MSALPSRPKILLVDDRPENLVALEAMLRGPAVEILTARSGREALEQVLMHEVALSIIDVQMPEMDGFEVAELMRGTERTRAIPIIFVTAGLGDPARVFKGYESGAVDFLAKPLDPHVLSSKVAVFLELYAQRRELADRVRELEQVRQQLSRADRRKDEFLAILSHELRNPLTPIRGSLYVLQHAAAPGAQAQRALEILDRQTSHLARLIDDLLDLTRVTRGKVHLQRERVDLVDVVRRCVDDHRAAFTDAGVELVVELPLEALTVEGDPTRLAQVVGNLLGNAVKFTRGGGHAWVSVDRDGKDARLRVRDDGEGIAPELLAHIFEPFSQADRTLDRSRGGLGLGLALARSLAELHGGTIVARSEGVGLGAELLVRLPHAPVADRAPRRSRRPPVGGRSRRVLVVDDSEDNAAMLQQMLELRGHEVAYALDGPSALTAARELAPEVVLCDIGLPGMDGYEVARRLRDEGCDAVLVAVSGYAMPEDRRRAFAAGFAEHLAKPPDLKRLERLIADA